MSRRTEQVFEIMKKMQDAQDAKELVKVLGSLSDMGADAVALGVAAPIVDRDASLQARVMMQDPSILIVRGVDPERDHIAQEIYLEKYSDYIDDGWYIGKRVNLIDLSDAYAVYTYLTDTENLVLKLSSGEYHGVMDLIGEFHNFMRLIAEYMSADDALVLIKNYLLLNGVSIDNL